MIKLRMNFGIWISLALRSGPAFGQALEAARVITRPSDRTIVLPGEFLPYSACRSTPRWRDLSTRLRWTVLMVKEGQLLATMIAPELNAQRGGRGGVQRSSAARRSGSAW
jgi:hypothetical protein